MSSLPACVRPFLEQQLDWDHGGVDRDLNAIAEHILDWEEKLSTPLELTRTEIHDIKFLYSNQPVLLRLVAAHYWGGGDHPFVCLFIYCLQERGFKKVEREEGSPLHVREPAESVL